MSKHTKGPWYAYPQYGYIIFSDSPHIGSMVADVVDVEIGPTTDDVVRMRGVGCNRSDEEMEANCRLIAESPEMYKELERMLNGEPADLSKIRRMLSKIDGDKGVAHERKN